MTPLELPVSDATIWSITLALLIMILEAPLTLTYDDTGITYENCQLTIVKCF
jgi:hypothetical protein